MILTLKSTSSYVSAFALGTVVLGGFDFLYTRAGGQSYSPRWILPPLEIWPWYVPLQMGLVGVSALFLWGRLLPALTRSFGAGPALQSPPRTVVFPMAMLLLCLAMSFLFLDHPWHASVFVLFLMLSLGLLAALGNRLEQVAFLVVGLSGGLAEWLLLSPGVDYWQFHHREFFSRLPAWEPSVYGWIGVVVHRLATSDERKS